MKHNMDVSRTCGEAHESGRPCPWFDAKKATCRLLMEPDVRNIPLLLGARCEILPFIGRQARAVAKRRRYQDLNTVSMAATHAMVIHLTEKIFVSRTFKFTDPESRTFRDVLSYVFGVMRFMRGIFEEEKVIPKYIGRYCRRFDFEAGCTVQLYRPMSGGGVEREIPWPHFHTDRCKDTSPNIMEPKCTFFESVRILPLEDVDKPEGASGLRLGVQPAADTECGDVCSDLVRNALVTMWFRAKTPVEFRPVLRLMKVKNLLDTGDDSIPPYKELAKLLNVNVDTINSDFRSLATQLAATPRLKKYLGKDE